MRNSGKSIWTPQVINNKNGRIMYEDIMCGVAAFITLMCMMALIMGSSTMLAICMILYALAVLAGIISLFFVD